MWSIRLFFFFQAEDGIRDLVRSRGLGDVYKRQVHGAELAGDDGQAHVEPGDEPVDLRREGEAAVEHLSLIHI